MTTCKYTLIFIASFLFFSTDLRADVVVLGAPVGPYLQIYFRFDPVNKSIFVQPGNPSSGPNGATVNSLSIGGYNFGTGGLTYSVTQNSIDYGTTIDASVGLNWNSQSNVTPANYPLYYGLKLSDGTNTNYGWAQIEVTEGVMGEATIQGMGWESNYGQSITAGQTAAVPEPSTLLLYSLAGCVGLAFVFFKRKPAAVSVCN